MEGLAQLVEKVVEQLKAAPALEEVRWFAGYPGVFRQLPLEGLSGSVDLAQVTMEQGSYLGEGAEGQTFACPMTVELEICLLCGGREEGARLRRLFALLCGQLMLSPGGWRVSRVWCKGIAYDKEVMGLCLKAGVSLTALAMKTESAGGFAKVRVDYQGKGE